MTPRERRQFLAIWFFLGLVPLLYVIRDRTPGRAFLYGWLAGFVANADARPVMRTPAGRAPVDESCGA